MKSLQGLSPYHLLFISPAPRKGVDEWGQSPGTKEAGICLAADALAGIKTSINIGLDIMRE